MSFDTHKSFHRTVSFLLCLNVIEYLLISSNSVITIFMFWFPQPPSHTWNNFSSPAGANYDTEPNHNLNRYFNLLNSTTFNSAQIKTTLLNSLQHSTLLKPTHFTPHFMRYSSLFLNLLSTLQLHITQFYSTLVVSTQTKESK